MTESTDLVTWSDERAGRVLDAAADLLVRWGYQRVTIDEVARRAGVGKGTVYLHFHNKEAMFLSVLLRSHHTLVSAMAETSVWCERSRTDRNIASLLRKCR